MVSTGKMLAFINALGGSSGPSEVVILPETVLTAESVADDLVTSSIATPPNASPKVGNTYAVTLNGVAYDITAIELDGAVLLSHDLASPSFTVAFLPPEAVANIGAYVVIEASPTVGNSITISIVEKAETASAGGGGMVIEEHGTQAGIIKSPLTTWDEWGVLKDSDLSGEIYETFNVLPMDTLKKGSKGEVVKWYQRGLVELGYDVGKAKDGSPLIDGIFGTEMVSVTRAFQSDNGLTADGMAGKLTMAKLKELLEDDEPDEDKPAEGPEETPSAPDGAAPPKVEPEIPLTVEQRLTRLELAVFGQEGGESDG